MKRFLLIAFTALSVHTIAQTNTFPASGNVGIGITPSTEYPLQVYKLTDGLSLINVQNSSVVSGSGSGIRFYTLINGGGGSWWSNIAIKGDSKLHFNMELKEDAMIVDQQGRVGIGGNPDYPLHVYKQTDGLSLITVQNSSVVSGSGSGIRFYTLNNGGGSWWSNIALKGDSKLHFNMELKEDAMIVDQQGRVGIGTTTPDQRLTVKGKIHAEEVIVDLNVPVADYVFKPNYKLMPLPEVEQYVKTNSHLPEIPSANEITKNGLSMGEMQNKLLQKVEELTLYAIQQNRKIEAIQKENEQYKAERNNLLAEQQQQLLELKKKLKL